MRISDWSSDVCSSDLRTFSQQGRAPMIVLGVSTKTMAGYKTPADLKGKKIGVTAPGSSTNMMASFFLSKHGLKPNDVAYIGVGAGQGAITALRTGQIDAIANLDPVISTLVRSEEHTSKLQSLMRISYAVFCLQKKNNHSE